MYRLLENLILTTCFFLSLLKRQGINLKKLAKLNFSPDDFIFR